MTKKDFKDGVSVIMPTYNQANFIIRAIASLKLQTFQNWELIIINDGSTDNTEKRVDALLPDSRVQYIVNPKNRGLGACLNIGLEKAIYNLIAYLPSDDIYFKDHLQSLFEALDENHKAVLAYSGIKYHYVDTDKNSYSQFAESQASGYDVQLVQVLHRKTKDRWIERDELITDDLYKMFWEKLEMKAECIKTTQITCEWVSHPEQRHKIMMEKFGGGIYRYKQVYQINEPIRFYPSIGKQINEIEQYEKFRKPKVNLSKKGLKILLVGELAYNAERIYSLEERGHQLYGLWIKNPYHYNAIGPLPFGNIEDIPLNNWQKRVKEIQPDIVYALLNLQAVPLAHRVLTSNIGIPFVWHFKEGPFFCRQLGTWQELINLYMLSDGQIYLNENLKDWYQQFIPAKEDASSLILDGDLPSNRWLSSERSPLLSDQDGEIHTLIPGRLMGLQPSHVEEMAKQKIHLHFYGTSFHEMYPEWIKQAQQLAPEYLHLHPSCTQESWVKEFSQYDAGWLHFFDSSNNGELMRASWSDLNYPARMATLAVAGVPLLQRDNTGHIVATQTLTKKLDIGIFFKNFEELGGKLRDKSRMKKIKENVWKNRDLFSFEYHVDDLVSFFQEVVYKKKRNKSMFKF